MEPSSPHDARGVSATGPAGILVGIGVSFAAMGSALELISKTMAEMSVAEWVTSLLGAFVVVVVPVSFLAILKLARQDLSALLEGRGRAINAQMRLTRAIRRQFTQRDPSPDDAEGTRLVQWCRLLPCLLLAGVLSLAAWYVPRLVVR